MQIDITTYRRRHVTQGASLMLLAARGRLSVCPTQCSVGSERGLGRISVHNIDFLVAHAGLPGSCRSRVPVFPSPRTVFL